MILRELVKISKRGEINVAYNSSKSKSNWVLFLLILSGIVLGGFLGSLADGVNALSWLNFGYNFGMNSPLALDLKIIFIQFKIAITINVASIIGIIIAIFVYRKI